MSQKKHSLTQRDHAELVDRQGNPPSLHLNQQKNLPTKNFQEKWNTANGTFRKPLFQGVNCVSAAQQQQELSTAPEQLQPLAQLEDQPRSWDWWVQRVPSPALAVLLVHSRAFPVHPAIPQGRPAGTSTQGDPLERLCCSPKAPLWQWQHPAAGHTPRWNEMNGEIRGKLAKFAAMDWLFIWEVFLFW